MSVKVSVIVPVYNAEKTLTACLGNLMHQTLPDMEFILVNDASTDQSLSILLDCERAFSDKVILINSERNSGPGGARNIGLSYASGEYIGFVDSDDVPDIAMYEKLYQRAVSGGCDMVDGLYFNEETDTLVLQTADNCTGVLDAFKRSELISGGGYLWSRIFKRELFEGLAFRENTILEDMETLMLLFMRTRRLGTVKELVYKYCASSGSASKLSNPVRYHCAIRDAMAAIADTILPLDDYAGVQDAIEYSILHLYQCGLVNALYPDSDLAPQQQKMYIKELRELRHRYVRRDHKKNPYVKKKITKENLILFDEIESF